MASGTDRIGTLPDDLLHHLLSFLPAHEAVATCVLARRWRHLWRSAPALRVTGVKGCYNPRWFVQFVDHLLLLRHPGAPLDSFVLDLDARDFDFKAFLPANDTHVNLWFRHAVLWRAGALALRTTYGIYKKNDTQILQLPNVPLISQHLKRLELQLVSLRSSTLDFSGCPVLVDLKMKECDIALNISSPFLKHLSIIDSTFPSDSIRSRIYLPNLVSLELSDFYGMTPLLESMPFLVLAVIRLSHCNDACVSNDYGDCEDRKCLGCYSSDQELLHDGHGESLLLKGLSEVTELELSVDSLVFIVNRDLKLCPTFGKLKTLLLSEWCPCIAGDFNVLTCFLQHSPILDKLTLQLSEVPKVSALLETQGSYSPSEQSFVCSHLKIVEIKCDEVDARVDNILNILSTHGIPLEQVNIQRTIETSVS